MKTKAAMGRPKLEPSEKRQARFLVKLNDAEYELIQSAAGPKVSTWARETLLRAAKRQSKRD